MRGKILERGLFAPSLDYIFPLPLEGKGVRGIGC